MECDLENAKDRKAKTQHVMANFCKHHGHIVQCWGMKSRDSRLPKELGTCLCCARFGFIAIRWFVAALVTIRKREEMTPVFPPM